MSKFISVPMTIEAMYSAEYGKWDETEHHVWKLTSENINTLWKSGIFNWLNDKLGLLIDDYEDENIYYQRLFFIKDDLYREINELQCEIEAKNLKKMIDYSIEHRTLLSIVL